MPPIHPSPRPRLRSFFKTGLLLSAIFSVPLGAQTPASQAELDTTVVKAKEARTISETDYRSELQTAAGFLGQSILDTPFQVTVFPAEVIRDQQARNLLEVTKNDPSISVGNNEAGFYDRVAVRGFYLFNAHRDGLAINDQAQVPLENKAGIEVVKGLAALRYGFVSPGGIINYVVKRPTEDPLARVNFYGTSFGTTGFSTDFSNRGGSQGQFGYRINTVLEQEHTFVDGVEGPRRLLAAAFDWRPSDRFRLDFELERQYRELPQNATLYSGMFAPGVDEQRIINQFDPTTFLGADWGTYPTWNNIYGVKARYELNEEWSTRVSFHRQDLLRHQNAVSPAWGSVQANGDYIAELYYSPDQERDNTVVEAALEGLFATGPIDHALALGYIFQKDIMTFPDGFWGPIGSSNIFRSRRIADPGVTSDPSYLAVENRQHAFFVADTVGLTDWLDLFGGVRYVQPQFNSLERTGNISQSYNDSALTPSGGIVIKPTNKLSLYASYAEGLEQGGQAPITAVNANQVMPPITSEQIEAGIKADLWKGTTLSAAVFEIDRTLEFLSAQNVYVQDGRQVHQGVEATLNGQVTDELRLIAGAAVLDATIEESGDPALNGQRPQGVPEWQANLFFDYNLSAWVEGLSVNTGLYASGEKPISSDNLFIADSYLRWDAGVRYRCKLGEVPATFRLNVLNVADERYLENTTWGAFGFGAPRSVFLGMELEF